MQSKMSILPKSKTLLKTLTLTLIPNSFKSISTFPFLSLPQSDPQSVETPSPPLETPSSLPPNPSSGSPLYHENWRNPAATATPPPSLGALIPINQPYSIPHAVPKDVEALMDQFASWVTLQRWPDIKDVFEQWIRSLDSNGKPNRPNVDLFNQYLRANLMSGANAGDLLVIVEKMEEYSLLPNTASYNLVIKSVQPVDWIAAVQLLERMLHSGNQSQPDDESYNLVIGMLFQQGKIDAALRYLDLSLKSGYMLSSRVFNDCVISCVQKKRLDTLVSVIEKCKAMDQNKALSPSWGMCISLAEVAIQNDNSKLTFTALGFMARLIQRGEIGRPPIYLSAYEGLVIKSLSTAARTYDSTLLEASWAILKRSLREKSANSETYVAKINAFASLGNLPGAFGALRELEKRHASSSTAAEEDLFSPFTSLHPLVIACSKKGYETLDVVYSQLENLSRGDTPFKSVAALNCVILGCANTWDLDRAYSTFEAISSSFGLTPNIHSFNALMLTFGKLRKTQEAVRVFEYLTSVGLKPNAMSYSLLADAHLVNRDPKAAVAVVQAMIEAGFAPPRATLLKIRRRCIREFDSESDGIVESIAKKYRMMMGNENRRSFLFNMEYSAPDFSS